MKCSEAQCGEVLCGESVLYRMHCKNSFTNLFLGKLVLLLGQVRSSKPLNKKTAMLTLIKQIHYSKVYNLFPQNTIYSTHNLLAASLTLHSIVKTRHNKETFNSLWKFSEIICIHPQKYRFKNIHRNRGKYKEFEHTIQRQVMMTHSSPCLDRHSDKLTKK